MSGLLREAGNGPHETPRGGESEGLASPRRAEPPDDTPWKPALLALVFALADALENGEARFLGVRNGEWLEFGRGAEARDNLADRLLAGGAFGEFGSREGAPQREFAAAG